MASAKAKIRHLFGDTFSCRAAPPDILVKLSDREPILQIAAIKMASKMAARAFSRCNKAQWMPEVMPHVSIVKEFIRSYWCTFNKVFV